MISLAYKKLIKKENEYNNVYQYMDRFKDLSKKDNKIYSLNQNVWIDKTIWIFWFQGKNKAPQLIQKCINSIERNMPSEYRLVLLYEENISEYVEFPEFVWKKFSEGKISMTHFSDILRIELLYSYGGCWIDATVFCSAKIPEYMLNGNLFVFKWSLIGESILKNSTWWMFAKKGSLTIAKVRNYLYNYWLEENKLINYYLLHIVMSKVIDEDSSCKAEFNSMPYVCNSNPHALYAQMEFLYEQDKWEIIKSNSIIHKLSYKRRFIQGDIINFYMAFMSGLLEA